MLLAKRSPTLMPPGPRKFSVLRALGSSTDARLDAMRAIMHEYGDIAHINVLGTHIYFLNEPTLIRSVLLEQADRFYDMPLAFRNTGIPTPERAAVIQANHRSMRRLLAPAFTPSAVAAYADTIVQFTQEWLDGWQVGETRDLLPDMTRLTLRIVAKVLFDVEISSSADTISEAVTRGMTYLTDRWKPVRTPVWIPTRSNIGLIRSWIEFDGTVRRIVSDRRANPTGGSDVLSRIFEVTRQAGAQLTVKQAHTEIMSLLIAGHETTATAMSWALYTLSRHPQVVERLSDEAKAATLNAEAALPYTHAVALELLRLYPPAYVLQRHGVQPTEIGGFTIPRGGSVFVSAYLMHRDPHYFDEPERFDPDRWLDGLEKRLPSFAYFPFGGGPHICTGQFLAWLELHLILATIARSARFRQEQGEPVRFAPTITLRPDRPIRLTRYR